MASARLTTGMLRSLRLTSSRSARNGSVALIVSALAALPAASQASSEDSLTFAAARERLGHVSAALEAANAGVRAKRDLSSATRHLRWPDVSIEARELDYRKTLDLSVGESLAGALHLPPTLRSVQQGWLFRPIVTATLPLYTGGRIGAAQEASAASVRQADAERDIVAQTLTVQLVQAYFGQQLAERALVVRRDVRDGLQQHLLDAEALEKQGLATKAQRLQAVVARDEAEREYAKSVNDLVTARSALEILLRTDAPVAAATPLFVIATPLASLADFKSRALAQHPQLTRLRAIGDQAKQEVRVQSARLKPELYAFSQYDLHRKDALLTDPDWAVGFGLRYAVLTGSGRLEHVAAAREQEAQAEAGLRDVAQQLEIGVVTAFDELDTWRSNFLLLESDVVQADENVRLQELSFREGESTSLDVIDARLRLGRARIDRAQAAYQFDVALARLLDLSGLAGEYDTYVQRADRVLEP